jgi:hypothetical protein
MAQLASIAQTPFGRKTRSNWADTLLALLAVCVVLPEAKGVGPVILIEHVTIWISGFSFRMELQRALAEVSASRQRDVRQVFSKCVTIDPTE